MRGGRAKAAAIAIHGLPTTHKGNAVSSVPRRSDYVGSVLPGDDGRRPQARNRCVEFATQRRLEGLSRQLCDLRILGMAIAQLFKPSDNDAKESVEIVCH